jgi:hypothetical protein
LFGGQLLPPPFAKFRSISVMATVGLVSFRVSHYIEITDYSVFCKARQLDLKKLRIAEAEFTALKAAGIFCRSNKPWSSPLHTVPKKGSCWRPCGN